MHLTPIGPHFHKSPQPSSRPCLPYLTTRICRRMVEVVGIGDDDGSAGGGVTFIFFWGFSPFKRLEKPIAGRCDSLEKESQRTNE